MPEPVPGPAGRHQGQAVGQGVPATIHSRLAEEVCRPVRMLGSATLTIVVSSNPPSFNVGP